MSKNDSLDTKDRVSIALFVLVSIFLAVLLWQGFTGRENESNEEAQQVNQERSEEEQTSLSDYFEDGGSSENFISTDEDPFIEGCLNQEADGGTTVSSNTVCLR